MFIVSLVNFKTKIDQKLTSEFFTLESTYPKRFRNLLFPLFSLSNWDLLAKSNQ